MVYLNLQIEAIAEGLKAMGWNTAGLPASSQVQYTATAPTSPANGQFWLDTTTSTLKIYSNGLWQTVALSASEYGVVHDLAVNGSYNKTQVDNMLSLKQDKLLAGGTVAGVTDHTLLSNVGANTHADIDTSLSRLSTTSGVNTGDQDLSGLSLTTHTHTGVYAEAVHTHSDAYEPADGTILKAANIGSTVQAFDAYTAKINVAQTFGPAQRGSLSSGTFDAAFSLDFASSNNFECTLAGNVVLSNPINIVAGQYGKITVIQDATGGRTIGYGTYFKFAGGVVPTSVTIANSKTSYYYEVASPTEIVLAAVSDWK